MIRVERQDCLAEAFKSDSGEYRDLPVPGDGEGKKRIPRKGKRLIRLRFQLELNPLDVSPCLPSCCREVRDVSRGE